MTSEERARAREILANYSDGLTVTFDQAHRAIVRAIEEEREACARACEERGESYRSTKAPGWREVDHESTQCAAAIRQRGEA